MTGREVHHVVTVDACDEALEQTVTAMTAHIDE
jgi:hypothetical protein